MLSVIAVRHDVSAAFKAREKLIDKGVLDRLGTVVRLEVALGHIGCMRRAMHQYVVPWPVPRRAGEGHGLIPVFVALELLIGGVYYPPIVEQTVAYELTDIESGLFDGHR